MDLSSGLQTFLAAMTPIGELRLSIPLAVFQYDLPWYQALGWSLAGNMVPVFLLVGGLERGAAWLRRSPNNPLSRLLQWRTERLRATQNDRFRRYGAVALVVLVAIPLPFTGAWTGSLAAWVFQIPPRQAIPLIALGVLIAGIIVTALTVTGIAIGEWFLKE